MSEINLSVAPSPELLKAATAASASAVWATGELNQACPPEGQPAGAPKPFAALLSGVLQGAQPPAKATASAPAGAELTHADAGPDNLNGPVSLLALPGIAQPLTAMIDGATDPAIGNPLPAGGKELPLPVAETAGLAPDRSRLSLADLAFSRPLEALPTPSGSAQAVGTAANVHINAPEAAVDGARTAAAAMLAGRNILPGGPSSGESRTADVRDYTGLTPGTALSPGAGTAIAMPGPLAWALTGAVAGKEIPAQRAAADLLRDAGGPVAGTEFLAGQLAAFAASTDSGNTATGASAPAGAAAPDSGSATLLARLGNSTLPPLQPRGDAGAFAAGLADRLLTLGGPGSHSARLKLHPEHLGELDVEISMDDGAAQVWFGTTTSQARDAIEGSLPRLRELFAEQGIQLTRTQIDASGAQMSNTGSGQQRHMHTGGYGAEIPAWQSATIRGRGGADVVPGRTPGDGAAARLLDVWA